MNPTPPPNSDPSLTIPTSAEKPVAYPPYWYVAPEEDIQIMDLVRILFRRKWWIILMVFLMGTAAYFLTRRMPLQFTTQVTMMPVSSSSGGGLGAMASQISALPLVGSSLGGLSDKLGAGKGKELTSILKSRTLTERIILRFDLMKVIFASQWDAKQNRFVAKWRKPIPVMEDAVNLFQNKISKVEIDKKSDLVRVVVTMKDSELAAKVANGMVVELQDFIRNNSLTVSKRNRIFIEEQLVKNRAKLLQAGKDLNQFYAQNKISSVVPELDVNVGSYEALPKSFEEFRQELDKLHQTIDETERKRETEVVRGIPGQVYLEYLTLNRELLNSAHALLNQQYEMAKIEEAKEDLAFQVIDKAAVMVRASSPKLNINVAVGMLMGLIGGIFLAFALEIIQKNPSPKKS